MQVKHMQHADLSFQVFCSSVAGDCVPLMSDATSLGKWDSIVASPARVETFKVFAMFFVQGETKVSISGRVIHRILNSLFQNLWIHLRCLLLYFLSLISGWLWTRCDGFGLQHSFPCPGCFWLAGSPSREVLQMNLNVEHLPSTAKV